MTFDFQKQREQAVVMVLVKQLAAIERPIASDLAVAVGFLVSTVGLDVDEQWGRLKYICPMCEHVTDCPDSETAFGPDEDAFPIGCEECGTDLTFKALVIDEAWVDSLSK